MDMCSKERYEGTGVKPTITMLRECQEKMSDTISELEHQQYEIYNMINEINMRLITANLDIDTFSNREDLIKEVPGHRERLAELKFKNRIIMDMLADIIQVL